MRLLAISDIHGNRTQLRHILSRASPADVIALAGDLTHLGSPDEAEEAVELCRRHTPLVLTVTGNCDDELIEKHMTRNGNSLTGAGRIVDGVGFFGVSAAQPFIGNTWEVGEGVLAEWAQRGYQAVAQAKRKVLVSHPPPYGFVDMSYHRSHGGSRAIRAALDRYDIALVVCGHIHEARGMARYNDTLIINCGPAWMGFYAEVEMGQTLTAELKQAT